MAVSKYAQLDDAAWLRSAYNQQGLSLGQIADKVGCSISAVHHAMTRHQIVRRPRRGNLPPSEQTLGDEMVRRYEGGETGERIAADLGVGRQTVYNVLAERGIERRTPAKRRTPGLDEANLRKLYIDQKIGAKRIAAKLGCSTAVVERALHRHGIPIRGRSLSNDDRLSEANLRRMYEVERLPVAQIAAELGISTVTLWKYLSLRGIPARTRSQAQRAKYPEEGTIRTRYIDYNGYVVISVVLPGGRVTKMAEHRHVMQQRLGRPLADYESVHHINGDRTDNRASNLQLRSGAHGAGVVYLCNTCGSDDVTATEIADPGPDLRALPHARQPERSPG